MQSTFLSLADFLEKYADDLHHELTDGELRELEPTGPHESVSGHKDTVPSFPENSASARQFNITMGLLAPRLYLGALVGGSAAARRPEPWEGRSQVGVAE